jgi:hypothetical protein
MSDSKKVKVNNDFTILEQGTVDSSKVNTPEPFIDIIDDDAGHVDSSLADEESKDESDEDGGDGESHDESLDELLPEEDTTLEDVQLEEDRTAELIASTLAEGDAGDLEIITPMGEWIQVASVLAYEASEALGLKKKLEANTITDDEHAAIHAEVVRQSEVDHRVAAMRAQQYLTQDNFYRILNGVIKAQKNGLIKNSTILDKNEKITVDIVGTELVGDNALACIEMLDGGATGINLLNSGFNVRFKAPARPQIGSIREILYKTSEQYGHKLGGVFYEHGDVFIKEHIIDRIIRYVMIKRDIANVKTKKDLLQAISIQDYETLLWGFVCAAHPKGVVVNDTCTGCGAVSTIEVDLNKLRFIDHGSFPEEAIALRKSWDKVPTKAQVKEYRKILSQNIVDNVYTSKVYPAKIHFKIPNLYEVITHGKHFYEKVVEDLYVNEHPSQTVLANRLNDNFFLSLVPWVEKIIIKHKGINREVKDPATIGSVLTRLEMRDSKIREELVNYIERTHTTFIGVPVKQCSCGTVNPYAIDGIVPYDIQTAFFTILGSLME